MLSYQPMKQAYFLPGQAVAGSPKPGSPGEKSCIAKCAPQATECIRHCVFPPLFSPCDSRLGVSSDPRKPRANTCGHVRTLCRSPGPKGLLQFVASPSPAVQN